MNFRKNLKRWLLALLAVLTLFLPACTKIEWGIQWADTYLAYKINAAFDFSGDSKKLVKSESQDFISELRRKEFPQISSTFSSAAESFSNLDWNHEAAVQSWVQTNLSQIQDRLNEVIQISEPHASKIAGLISKDNWQSFQKSFDKENRKLSQDQFQCYKKFHNELENWLGSMNSSQQDLLQNFCDHHSHIQETKILNRQHLLQVFQNWLTENSDFVGATQKWIRNYAKIQIPESDRFWNQDAGQLLTQLLWASTEAQKKNFLSTLKDRAQSFQKLSL